MSSNRLVALSLALFIAGFACLTQAQVPMTGGGLAKPATGAGYTGPSDIVASPVAWWGLRCMGTATNQNIAIVKSPSDALTTTITCSTGGILGSTGTAIGTTCATSCTVHTLHDQSGASSCSGACDMVQATEASRAAYTLNCIGALPCMTFGGSALYQASAAWGAGSIAQPNTQSMVCERTGGAGARNTCIGMSDFSSLAAFSTSANLAEAFAGNDASATANDNVVHAMNFVFNSASSRMYIDGSSSTVDMGTQASGGTGQLGQVAGGSLLNGKLWEAGIWSGSFSSGVSCASQAACLSAMNSNQHAYWGF